jgi:hypothetical protein
MKSGALTIPHDGGWAVPVPDLRDVPLEQLTADTDARATVNRTLGKADQPPVRGTMFSSAI